MVVFSLHIAQAQVNTAKTLVRIETPQFTQVLSDANYVYVPMKFNAAETKKKLAGLDVSKIESISLVYTQFRASERFDQLALNDERTVALFKLLPDLKNHPEIKWFWVAQTACDNPDACHDFFHGFEIRLKSDAEIRSSSAETAMLDYYSEVYSGKEADSEYLDSLVSIPGTSLIKICDTTYVESERSRNKIGFFKQRRYNAKQKFVKKLNRSIDVTGNSIEIIVDSRKKVVSVSGIAAEDEEKFKDVLDKYYYLTTSRLRGDKTYTKFTLELKQVGKRIQNFRVISAPVDDDFELLAFEDVSIEYEQVIKCNYIDTSVAYAYTSISDDVITKVFDRNTQWKNCMIVTDVTGSMSPYLGQFLAWHQLNLKSKSRNRDFVFFNDGDNMRDALKRTGKVGGVYYTQTDDYQKLRISLVQAQTAGGGGDGPENNVEAVIFGLNKNPNIKEVIMIADNWATPRDIALLKYVNKPIHVILCGATAGVNTDYLDLVRANGGTIHTMEEDISNLAKLNEGETIEIGNQVFIIRNGQFTLTKRTTALAID